MYVWCYVFLFLLDTGYALIQLRGAQWSWVSWNHWTMTRLSWTKAYKERFQRKFRRKCSNQRQQMWRKIAVALGTWPSLSSYSALFRLFMMYSSCSFVFFQHFQPILYLRSFDVFQLHSLVAIFVHFFFRIRVWRRSTLRALCTLWLLHLLATKDAQKWESQSWDLRTKSRQEDPSQPPFFPNAQRESKSCSLASAKSKNQAMSGKIIKDHSEIILVRIIVSLSVPSHTEPQALRALGMEIVSTLPSRPVWRIQLLRGEKQSSKRSTDFVYSGNHEWFWMIMRFLIKIWTSNSQFQSLEKTQLDNTIICHI